MNYAICMMIVYICNYVFICMCVCKQAFSHRVLLGFSFIIQYVCCITSFHVAYVCHDFNLRQFCPKKGFSV